MRSVRTLIGLTAAVGSLSVVAQAQALPTTPGVVPIGASASTVSDSTYTVVNWRATYNSLPPGGGSLTGNNLLARVSASGDTVTFDSPLTLMLALPPAEVTANQMCVSGFEHASCKLPHSGPNTFASCYVFVGGGPVTDRITVESGTTSCGYAQTYDVAGRRGNDVINVRDYVGGDFVSCGLGVDKVIADRGDVVARDCESVQRG